ncbi:arsenate reductase [Paracidovorax sp. MALMAid1276]|uniref:arsenate reductase n=1 Tax=Paracidovorax sp. MALMAid1276 TaxID=3411631 RepID=UPI003B992764
MTNASNTPSITLYGIPQCDTVKKSRAWFTGQGIDHQFHDFKKQGVPADLLTGWMAAVGWQKLVNRQGTTWRKLPPAVQAGVTDEASAAALMLEHTSVVKRPVVVWRHGGQAQVSVGYSPEQWQAWADAARAA